MILFLSGPSAACPEGCPAGVRCKFFNPKKLIWAYDPFFLFMINPLVQHDSVQLLAGPTTD